MNRLQNMIINRSLTLRHILLIVCSFALFPGKGASLAYEVSPGKLLETISEIPAGTDQITLTGCIDASDFEALRRIGKTEGLNLDLGKLSIAGGRLPDGIFTESLLTELTWPASAATLPVGAISHSRIERLHLPSAIREIGEYALSGCDRLTVVDGGEGVETIGEGAFADCIALRSLPGMTNVESIYPRAFSGSGVESLSFPRVAKLHPYALSLAPRLENVTLGREVTLGKGALANCLSLRSVGGLPAELPDLLFALSPMVESPSSEAGVIGIGSYAYAGNASERLDLCKGLREIKRGAFADMEGLKDIYAVALEGEIPLTDDDAFEGIDCEEVTLHVATQFLDLWSAHPVWGRFKIEGESNVENVIAEPEEMLISSSGGWLTICGDGTERDVEVYTAGGVSLFKGSCRDTLRVNLTGCSEKILIVTMTGKRSVKIFLR